MALPEVKELEKRVAALEARLAVVEGHTMVLGPSQAEPTITEIKKVGQRLARAVRGEKETA